MKTKLSTLFIALFLLLSGTIQAKKVWLRFNLQKGAQYDMIMDVNSTIDQTMMGQEVDIKQKMNMVLNWKVLDVTANKTFVVEYVFQKFRLDMSVNGQQVVFDSDSTDGQDPALAALKALNQTKLQLEFTDQGKILNVSGMDELANKFSGNQVLAQSMQMFTNENNFKSFLSQTFNYFPENQVETGDTWSTVTKLPSLMNMETKMNFEVEKLTRDRAYLNITSLVNLDSPIEQAGMKINVKMDGTQTGEMEISLKDGWMNSSNLKQDFSMTMKLKNPQSGEDMEIPLKISSTANTTVVRK